MRQIRGQKVLLDTDLAALYGVTTKRLNEQINLWMTVGFIGATPI